MSKKQEQEKEKIVKKQKQEIISSEEEKSAIPALLAEAGGAVALPAAPDNPYHGISEKPVTEKEGDRLLAPLDPLDVEIRPDGIVFLPEIKYRRILNQTFGPMGWGLIPMSPISMNSSTISREYGLYARGRFVSCARGEQEYFENNSQMTYASASECVKSNAMMRCCKDLGIASELWDPGYIHGWKQKYALVAWCTHVKDGKKRLLWRRKDRPALQYPYKETANLPANVVMDQDPFQDDPPSAKSVKSKTTNFGFLKEMTRLKEAVGEQAYYQVLGVHGIEHANEITDRKKQVVIWEELSKKADELEKAGKLLDDKSEKEESHV